MSNWFHSWRAAVRIARRDAWRYKGRSFLVLAMIALPILGVSAADLTLRSSELSTEQKVERSLGRADARITDPGMGGTAVFQDPAGEQNAPAKDIKDGESWPEGTTDLSKVVPAGAKTLEDTTASGKFRTTHGLLYADIRELKATDPMAEGIMDLTDGRFPERAGEVAATTHFLDASGLKVGSSVSARGVEGTKYLIVGAYELPNDLKAEQVNALPGTFIDPLNKALAAVDLPTSGKNTTQLVTVTGGFTWNMVKEANTKGAIVTSRLVALDPPADSEVPLYQKGGWSNYEQSTAAKAALLAAVGTIVGLAILEICLLAGPAFAVGARRSRRQLGLVGANGGERRHIRAIVLSGGLVIGIAAAVVGTLLGMLLTFALQPLLEDYMGKRFGSFDIRPLELLGIGLLAVFTGLMAAIVPAVTSSRQTVLASLTGRRGVRRSSRVLPVIGLIAVALGAATALYGSTMSSSSLIVAGGSAVAELGIVALTPAMVGLFGRAGRILPLSPRLALRDAVRNRGRTAPAVAAVLAAVAGTVAVATYTASTEAQHKAEYTAELPYGTVSVSTTEAGGRDVPQVRSTVQKDLPVDVRADVDRIAVGKASCELYSDSPGCGRYEVVTPKANICPLWAPSAEGEDPSSKYTVEERRKLGKDWRCLQNNGGGIEVQDGLLVGDAKLMKVLGINDPASVTALSQGQIVSFDKRNITPQSKIDIRLITDPKAADAASAKGKDAPGAIKSFAAHQASGSPKTYGITMIMPPSAARAAGLVTVPYGAYFTTDKMPSSAQQQRLDSDIDKLGTEVALRIEKGWTPESSIVLISLTVFAGLITIGAAGIATGLAQADAEADLKTLAAVGAAPRVRRTLSGFQCGVVAVMGVVLGSAAGVLPAIGLRFTEKREQTDFYRELVDQGYGAMNPAPYVPVVVPWATLAALLIAVPLGAALLAALVTRSHGALARRAAV
ncbi:ABC transporter permease [Streptomyces sp. NBC_01465]|uniref:ABC transporter permease n=1 Tax=Streptomyces sp. NBC_01465 TaxID=2903878 RepID=UPI002E31B4D9|nr:ABC transporter permease [Streptomyces sp. NBC_01465]